MTREILFGKHISDLRRKAAWLECELQVLLSLHTYTAAMDQFDLYATERDLTYALEAIRRLRTKLETPKVTATGDSYARP